MVFNGSDEIYGLLFLAGAAGALLADILQDNCLTLPKNLGGKFFLGSVGGLIVGGFAGMIIDGSYLTAMMGGFMGKEVIARLIARPSVSLLPDSEIGAKSDTE